MIGNLFQFHKGTIRTNSSVSTLRWSFLFQFHKGTIRTFEPSNTRRQRAYFNSIKVRLEQLGVDDTLGFEVFQFHKGTIRTGSGVKLSLFLVKFQFHKGTIRTKTFTVGEPGLVNFNSIKVRLELSVQIQS